MKPDIRNVYAYGIRLPEENDDKSLRDLFHKKKFKVGDNIVKRARNFALKYHGDQKYGPNLPYIYHLESVVNILAEYKPETQVVGYLHDVIEDTKATEEIIQKEFGDFVAECVYLVSDEPGPNRKARKERTHKKLKAVTKEYESVLIVKAADRLANISASIIWNQESLFEMYVKEMVDFRGAVYRLNLCDEIWIQMEFIVKHKDYILNLKDMIKND